MLNMKIARLIFLFYTTTILSTIQGQTEGVSIPFTEKHWKLAENVMHNFEVFENQPTLVLNGKAIAKNVSLKNGIIEVDVYANQKRSFAGIVFRKQGETMEEVYMRNHKNGQPDAVQYSPTFNGELTWQLYREFQAQVLFEREGWNSLKVLFNQQQLEVWINDKKVLQVDELKTENSYGEIGLFSLFENRFANFRYRETDNEIPKNSEIKPIIDANVIKEWNLSEAFMYTPESVESIDFSGLTFQKVSTENSGLLPVSKYLMKPSFGNFEANEETFAVVSTNLTASNDTNRMKFSFDYSDKIIVFLNGKKIFEGNNAFLSKGQQFQGHIGLAANTIYLDLKPGENSLHCVVIDKANGWGIVGRIAEAGN